MLTLTTTFRQLELIGFDHALGWRATIILPIEVRYIVENAGDVSMVAESASITSDFTVSAFHKSVLIKFSL